jgi:hypothetical protein
MWVRELDVGILCEAERAPAVVLAGAGVRVPVTDRAPGGRMLVDEVRALGLGVTLRSAEGIRDLVVAGVRSLVLDAGLGSGPEVSDLGGEGGSWMVGMLLLGGGRVTSSGGVLIRGELAVERGECSKVGDAGMEMSVLMVDR